MSLLTYHTLFFVPFHRYHIAAFSAGNKPIAGEYLMRCSIAMYAKILPNPIIIRPHAACIHPIGVFVKSTFKSSILAIPGSWTSKRY